MVKTNWKLPSLDPDGLFLENVKNFLITDDSFMPFTQLQNESTHVQFSQLLEILHLPADTPLAVTSHQLTYPSQWHNHDYIEILYILEGRLLHLTKKTTIIMESESLCVIPLGESHLIAPVDDQSATAVNVLIHPDLFKKIAELDSHFPKELFQMPLILDPSLMSEQLILNLKTFILDYYKNEYVPTLVTMAHLMTVLHEISRHSSPNQKKLDRLTEDCLRLIKKHSAAITQKKLSQLLNYSQGHLSRHIKHQTGKTISQHIAQAKLDRARQLLLDSNLTIRQVAEDSGYQSESHFHRVFKEKMAVTPKQYRKIVQ